jgi:hypothetical protein
MPEDDPFEYPGCELWRLRREQRTLIRYLPNTLHTTFDYVSKPNIGPLDPIVAELWLRHVIDELLAHQGDAITKVFDACQLRVTSTLYARNYRPSPLATTQFVAPLATEDSAAVADAEAEIKPLVDHGGALHDALALCVWADMLAHGEFDKDELDAGYGR